jgi:hypothetical protein
MTKNASGVVNEVMKGLISKYEMACPGLAVLKLKLSITSKGLGFRLNYDTVGRGTQRHTFPLLTQTENCSQARMSGLDKEILRKVLKQVCRISFWSDLRWSRGQGLRSLRPAYKLTDADISNLKFVSQVFCDDLDVQIAKAERRLLLEKSNTKPPKALAPAL